MDSQSTNPSSRSASPPDSLTPAKRSGKSHRKKNSKGPSSTTNTAGRLACDICRERKVRCDRADPKCGRCTRLGHDCSYLGRTRHRASQADLPRQLSQIQDRLAQAEARLAIPLTSPTDLDLSTRTESPWHFVSTYEPHADRERTDLVRNHLPVTETSFEEFDMFANFPKEAQDSSGSDFGWTSVVPPIPEMLPTPESLHTSMELCGPLTDVNPGHQDFARPSPSHSSQGDEEVPLQDMAELHRNYFEVFYPAMPILSMRRFYAELAKDSSSSPIRSLNYAVALVGTTISPKYAHMQQTCYNIARKHVELCERDEDETDVASLNMFQALLFIIRYELTSKRFTRAWMTLGRAIRLAKMLDLHQMDRVILGGVSGSDLQMCLPPTQDLASLEERRRSFWSLYIFESYASTRTGMPCQLCEAQMFVALPSPGYLTEDFTPSPMPLLSEASGLHGISQISSYTGIVLMVALSRLCYKHVSVLAPDAQEKGFWDRHYDLVKTVNDRTAMLHMHLNAKAVREDSVAFTLHINLCAVDIFLHEAAIDEVNRQELPKLVAAESRKRSAAAAFKISCAVRMNWPVQRSERDIFTLQGTFIGWPLVMGLGALSRNLLESEDATSNGVADSLRLLLTALDQVEEPGRYWHNSIAGVATTLKEWDEKQGGFPVGAWNATHSREQQ